MFRRIIATGLTIATRNCIPKIFPPLRTFNRFFYSQQTFHPTIQRIIKGDDITELDSVLVQIGGLNDKNREIALKLILKSMYSQKLPPQTVENEKFLTQVRKNPQIYIDSHVYLIKTQIHKLDSLMRGVPSKEDNAASLQKIIGKINKIFNGCFEVYKEIPKEKSMRSGLTLNKRFADYYLLYIAPLYGNQQKQSVLKKSCEVYRSSIMAMGKLINEEGLRIRLAEESQSATGQKPEETQMTINTIKQSLRILVETNAQNVLNLFKGINELNKIQKNNIVFMDGIIETLSNLQRAINYYRILENMKKHSIFYHHMKKIKAEINHYSKLSSRKQKEQQQKIEEDSQLMKQFSLELKQVHKEAAQDLAEVSGDVKGTATACEIAIVMFNIQIELLIRKQKDVEIFKQKILEEIQLILSNISNAEVKKVVSSRLAAALSMLAKSTKTSNMQNKSTLDS